MKQHKTPKTAARMAFVDISQHLKEIYKDKYPVVGDEVWIVTPDMLNSKETRRLNKLLGLNSLNYEKNTNGFKKKIYETNIRNNS